MSVKLSKFENELNAALIPIWGVRAVGNVTIDGIADSAEPDFRPEATQPQRDNAAAILAAHDPSTPIQNYSNAFNAQKRTIYKAFYTFTEAFRTASATPTLTEYRTALGNTLTILLTLPASFTTELAHEQAGLGAGNTNYPNPPTTGWTLAQCQAWHSLLSGWLGRAMAGVAGAMIDNLD